MSPDVGLLRSHALTGTTAVVTGGASGIGRCTAVELARAGADVVVADLVAADDTVAAIVAEGGTARRVLLDVTDREACHAVIGTLPDIGVVVTCAGVYGETSEIDDLTADELHRVTSINYEGTVWAVRAALPAIRRSEHGRVVCVSSAAGKMGGSQAGLQYAGSKGAVNAFVKWLARREAARGVLVNAIAPGAVETPMIEGRGYSAAALPLQRLAKPEEIAVVAAFLSSPLMSYATGTVLDVNGGMYMG